MPVSSFIAHCRKSDNAQQSVSDHLQNVSALAKLYASKIGLGCAGELAGLLHDFGKYSQAFQNYLKSAERVIDPDADEYVDAGALKGTIDHSTAGAQYVWRDLSKWGGLGPYVGQLLALCIASHHSGLIDCLSGSAANFGEDLFTRRMNKAAAKTHMDEVMEAADPAVLARAAQLLGDAGLVESIKILATRIVEANGDLRIPMQQQFGLMVRFLFSCLLDADRTDTADFENSVGARLRQRGDYADWSLLAERLEQYLLTAGHGSPIDELRREISQHCRDAAKAGNGVFTLTVPTGGGKTLASLRFALHHAQRRQLDRIFYVIPFTSIIDQNAEVIRSILELAPGDRGRIVLEHHSNLTPERQSWREKILSENWDAPVVCTTMVQFLESLFGAGTRGARRMHQLANSVLIFDEVQTLPIPCVHLFNNAVNFLVEQCNSTVVLCTATQPLLDRVALEKGAIRLAPNHELMPNRQRFFDALKRVEVHDRRKPGGWSYEEVATLALDSMRREGSCLVVVNTKDAARKVYELCRETDSAERVHLSTNMCPAHRKQKLAYVRQRLADALPVVCISTQLIEAGVDIDFASVIRFLAGIDSIAQAAGRCNRNGRPKPGIIHIVNPEEENLDRLPDICTGRDVAERVLDDFRDDPARYRHNLFGPEALEHYYKYYFFERQREMSYPISTKELGRDDTLLNLLSGNKFATEEYFRKNGTTTLLHFPQSFMTAADLFKSIDAPTSGVIVPFGEEGRQLIGELCAAYEVEKQCWLLRRAQQFTVNVFPHVLEQLRKAGAAVPIQETVDILRLDDRYYSDEFGLSTEPAQAMEILQV